VQSYLQGWRAMFPGSIEMDIYEDLDQKKTTRAK
jgi:hypothetical protein